MISPVQKSVNASPASRTNDGVFKDGFLQIAAKTTAFPATATGAEIVFTAATIKDTKSYVGPSLARRFTKYEQTVSLLSAIKSELFFMAVALKAKSSLIIAD